MALNDVKHVEAYAIIRRIVEQEAPVDLELRDAAVVWMNENKPSSSAYSAAARSLGTTVDPEGMGG